MSIYLEANSGKFRVEVQGKLGRYRARCDTNKQAKARELEFIRLRGAGVGPATEPRASRTQATPARSFSAARRASEGRLWRGMASEQGNLSNLRTIETLMGDVDLDTIDAKWVQDLHHKLLEGEGRKPVSEGTANRYISALSKFLQWCVTMKLRDAAVPPMPWVREQNHRIRWITPDEEQLMYALLEERYARLVGLAIRTGLRRGELLSLEPTQIQDGWVHIWKTKSNSPRSLPLTPQDESDLRALVKDMPTVDEMRKAWKRMRSAMKLTNDKEFVLHACRHTCATRMVQRNVNLRLIQQWMGHKDIKMTLRYAQVSNEMLSGVLEKMAA